MAVQKVIAEVLRLDSSGESLLKVKDMYCNQGRTHFNRGKFDFAEKIVKEVLRLDSNYEAAHQLSEKIKYAYCNRGSSLLRRSQYEEAISSFEKALEIGPDFMEARCGIARACVGQGELAGAKEAIREIFQINSNFLCLEKVKRAYCDLGFMYLTQDKISDAKKAIKEMLLLDSIYEPVRELLIKIKNTYYDRGYTCLMRGELTEAEKAVEESLDIDPGCELARELLEEIKHIYQAQGSILLNRDEKSEFYFQKANAIGVNFTEIGLINAYCWLGNSYLRQKELELAKAAVDEALYLDLEHESVRELLKKVKYTYCDRGFKFLGRNQYDEAIIYFRNLLSMDTNFTEAYCGIALAYLGQGQLAALKEVVDEVSGHGLNYESNREFFEEIKLTDYVRGINLLSQNQYDEAITCFENLLSMDADFMEAHCGIALAYLGQDELEVAEQAVSDVLRFKSNYEYESACAILEDIKQTYCDRAIAFLNEYQYNEAITNFEDAIAVDVNFAEAYIGLQDAYLGFGTVYLGQLDVIEESAEAISVMSRGSRHIDLLALATQLAPQTAYLTEETESTENTYGWNVHEVFGLSLPSDMVEKIHKFDDVYVTLCHELQREPRCDEIAEVLDLPVREVVEIFALGAGTVSMDLLVNPECSTETLGDLIEDSAMNGEEV